MSTRLRAAALAISVSAGWLAPERAAAARVLFVSDDGSDLSIADVLRGDGHDVTSVEGDLTGGLNPSFHPDLSGYDCIVWSAAGLTTHSDTVAFANLRDFVSNGGAVFVTGYGAVGYGDMQVIRFLGGTGGTSYSGAPLTVVDLDTDLTTGIVDLRGVTPRNFGAFGYEALTGLGADTLAIVGGSYTTEGAQWSIRNLGDGHVAWVAGIDGVDREWTDTASGPDGAFNAALRNFAAASTGTASVPGAPRIAFNAPYTAVEGAALTVGVRVTDPEGDTLTYSWDLDGDGVYGEASGTPMVELAEGTTDGPGNFVVSVEASDGAHTSHRSRSIAISNVAPAITSRAPTTAAIAQHVRYALVVADPAGAHDPPAFTLRTGPATAIVTPEGTFDWTPTEAEITAPGTTRAVVVDVDDGDGGTTSQAWAMTVIDDHAPTDPVLLYPGADTPILIAGAHFAIGNSSDLDGDGITYELQLDAVPSFDSADLQSSGTVTNDPSGITTWAPDESALHYGRWYWRVSASDGRVTTSPITSSFLFVPDPTMFPDVGTPDGGADGGALGVVPRGCGCAVAAASRPPGWLVLTLLALALARRRRR